MSPVDTDLFGQEIVEEVKRAVGGYARPPGSGPVGETCGSCAHCMLRQFSKKYFKCGLLRHAWTRGPGTDIRKKSPACSMWQAKPSPGVNRGDAEARSKARP